MEKLFEKILQESNYEELNFFDIFNTVVESDKYPNLSDDDTIKANLALHKIADIMKDTFYNVWVSTGNVHKDFELTLEKLAPYADPNYLEGKKCYETLKNIVKDFNNTISDKKKSIKIPGQVGLFRK